MRLTVIALLLLAHLPEVKAQPDGLTKLPPVKFGKEIAPILVRKCVTCHGPDKVKGRFQLHTFDRLMQGGESKLPAIVAQAPAKSELYRRITTPDKEDRMPQKDDPLPAADISLIERWITEGAPFDGPDTKAALLTLVPPEDNPSPPEFYPRPVPILALAFSPDGKELAASAYHELTIWNPANGNMLRRRQGLPERTQSIAYSPDGSWLAIGGGAPGKSGEVVLMDMRKKTADKRLGRTSDMVLAVCISPDGGLLAAGGADNAIRIYDVSTGQEQRVIQQHADWVMALAFDREGARLASASRDRTARIYDTRTGGLEVSYAEHAAPVLAIAFGDDGKLVYSAGRDKKIQIWSAQDGKKSGEIAGFQGEIYKLIAQGGQLFTCAEDHQVRQHSMANRKLVRSFTGQADAVYALAYDAPTQRLASGSYDGQVRIWNVESGATLAVFKAFPTALAAESPGAKQK